MPCIFRTQKYSKQKHSKAKTVQYLYASDTKGAKHMLELSLHSPQVLTDIIGQQVDVRVIACVQNVLPLRR